MRRVVVILAMIALGCSAPRADARPSFNCKKAKASAEQLICRDAQLARLDRETQRLYLLARDGAKLTRARRKELIAYQRGWIKGRNDCWKATDLRRCVEENYVIRIHELRRGYAAARARNGDGISRGPLALACRNFDAGISLSFVEAEPALAYLGWRDKAVVLKQQPSGSGSRYTARTTEGAYSLSLKGDGAVLELPGKRNLSCRIEQP